MYISKPLPDGNHDKIIIIIVIHTVTIPLGGGMCMVMNMITKYLTGIPSQTFLDFGMRLHVVWNWNVVLYIPNKLENRFLVLVLPYLACSLVIYFQSSSLSICVEKDL